MGHNEQSHVELHHLLFSKLTRLYIFQAFMSFAKSMIGMFVPVYLYSLGFSISEIIIYGIGVSVAFLFFIPLAVKTIKKIGFKYTFLLTVPIYFSHIITLNYIDTNPALFHLAWITIGMYIAFFWPAFHSEMALNGTKSHRGSEVGTLQIITTILRSFGPFIGGVILGTLGYWDLLITISVIVSIGLIPLLFTQDIKLKNYDFGFRDYIRLIKSKKHNLAKIAFAAEGIEGHALGVFIWPIIVFLLLGQDFVKLGILLTVVSLIGVMFIFYFKKYIDKNNKNKILKVTTKLLSLHWFFKALILSFGGVFLFFVESLSKLIGGVFGLSFMSIFYNNAKKAGEYMDYIILRELYLHVTKILFLTLMLGVFYVYGESIRVLTYIIIIGVVMPFALTYLKEE